MNSKLEITTLAELLRASHIKRWGIVQHVGTQNIAEHMYRVWTMVRHLGPKVALHPEEQQKAELLALLHDVPEIRTGDSPTPIKVPEFKAHLAEVEREIYPELAELHTSCEKKTLDLLKFCDTAEAVLFLQVNGVGQHAQSVMLLLEKQMEERLRKSGMPVFEQDVLMVEYRNMRSAT